MDASRRIMNPHNNKLSANNRGVSNVNANCSPLCNAFQSRVSIKNYARRYDWFFVEHDIWLHIWRKNISRKIRFINPKKFHAILMKTREHLCYFLKCFILDYSSRRRCRVISCAPCYLAIEFPVNVLRRVAPYLDNESEERAVPGIQREITRCRPDVGNDNFLKNAARPAGATFVRV